KICCGNAFFFVELLLLPLVLDQRNDFGLWVNFFPLRLLFFECIGIDVLDLDSDDIAVFAKLIYRIEVGERTMGEMHGNVLARSIGIGVEYPNIYVEVNGRLNQHSAQLSAS